MIEPEAEQVQTPVELIPSPPLRRKPRRNLKSAKAAGAWMERITAEFLASRLNEDRIERRTKNGSNDRGDITGVKTIRGGRVVIECKNVRTLALPAWLREAEIERGNDDAVIGVVVHKASGTQNPADQHVTMTLETFARLLEGGGDT
ncbi:MAG: hypothetical protein ABWX92_17190 [Mycetocola sp.]